MTRQEFTIRQEGTCVQLIVNGKLIADMPWDKADEIAKAIGIQARKAEEIAKRDQVMFDHAIMLRLGTGIGLANDPYLRREAARIAQWDSKLRNYLPGGVKSEENFGTPTIKRHKKDG